MTKNRLLSAGLLAGVLSLVSSAACAEPLSLPYFNPCEDISTVTVYNDGTTANQMWHFYTWNGKLFRHAPRETGNTFVSQSTLWTPELAFEPGKTYEVNADIGVWTASTYSKAEIALCKSPDLNAEKSVLRTVSNVPVKGSSTLTTFSTYFVADPSTPRYLSIANRGGGKISFFMLDNISVREVDPMMPQAATALTASAQGKNVTGSFTAPLKNVTGGSLDLIRNVRLMRGGFVVCEWTDVAPGQQVSFSDFCSTTGDQVYSVVCGNNGFYCAPVEVKVTVGASAAATAPTFNPNYHYYLPDGTTRFGYNYMARATFVPGEGVKVDWEPYDAGEGVEVTYTVTRVQDDKVIASSISGRSVTDTDALKNDCAVYTYRITAHYGDTDKDVYISGSASLHLPVPVLITPSRAGYNEMTAIDGDRDQSNWGYIFNSSYVSDYGTTELFRTRVGDGGDHLITPGVDLAKGKTYRIDVTANAANIIPKTVSIGLAVGRSNTMEAMTDTVLKPQVFTHMLGRDYSSYYTPADDGQFFFDVLALNPLEEYAYNDVGVLGIRITEVSGTVPEAIESISVRFSATPGEATLCFDAPAKDVTGNPIEALTKIEVYKNGALDRVIASPAPGSPQEVTVSLLLGKQDHYTLIPYTAGGAGLGTSTDVMVIEPPYTNSFYSEDYMDGFSTINPGQSGEKWAYFNNSVRAYPDSDVGHDAYLVSPPVHLEGGQFYRVDFLTWQKGLDHGSQSTNTIELLLGAAPTLEGLSRHITEPVTVKGESTDKAMIKEWFSVPETGEYYLAWHVTAPRNGAVEIYLDDIRVGEALDPTHPGGVTDMKVTPDPQGALKSTIEFNLPVNDLAGNPLRQNIYQWHLYRDGEQIKYNYSDAPGTRVVFEDASVAAGVHTYTVCCDLKNGSPSREIDRTVFVGINRPAGVSFVEAEENPEKYGEVTVSWGTPETDIDGFPLNTTDITYTVGQYFVDIFTGETSQKIYTTEARGTEYTLTAKTDADRQEFARFYVCPSTSAGPAGISILSHYIAVGKPYRLPVRESFRNATPSLALMSERTADGSPATWGFNTMNPVTKVEPADDDHGLSMMESMYTGGASRLYTGRINLDIENPVVTFWIFNQSDESRTDENVMSVDVCHGDKSEFVSVESATIDAWAGGRPGWQKAMVDLSEWSGKVVYLGFNARSVSHTFTHLDGIRVSEPRQVDLGLISLETDRICVGTSHEIRAEVRNYGTRKASGTVVLSLDDSEAGTADFVDLEPGETALLSFSNMLGRGDLGKHRYSAVLNVEDDGDNVDNKRAGAEFILLDNSFPTVIGLQADENGAELTLSWLPPVLPDSPSETVEDFENFESWSTMTTGLGEWNLVDADEGQIGGFTGWEMPNAPKGSRQSFVLFDFSEPVFGDVPEYRAHSGSKVLGSIFNADGTYNSDLLISPRLSGGEQTLSFWCKSVLGQGGDHFRVYASSTGSKVRDFGTPIAVEDGVTADWQEFSFTLPEGTRYFMIQHYNYGSYFFFLDDIRFTPEGDETLLLNGYNVYTDGTRVNEAPVEDTTWRLVNPEAREVEYGVTAVYDRGESPVETVLYAWNGIDATESRVTVTAHDRDIIISGAEGLHVSVASVAGLVLTSRVAEADMTVPVGPGVYLVTVAGKTVKIAVD